ncbi:hypothetical protein BDV96DRAFT_604541 [Lophiotrema nucula]|uniref:Uncharacterized protein n=1 Tax=Lophiotrema nucula TaxID=690887 RepID=A0A6A5YRJ2_9PLEO|nr:hypothetical protein BDV96DRAFT_604541 [Lophiotrema nucula]
MVSCFLPRQWRWPKVMLAFLIAEFPFTVANLALFGIASPNLYRTKLWQEGSDHGWASRPDTVLYSIANHQPVHTPLVWSNFNTQYNLVIGVLSMFFYLVKFTLYIMDVFYPILSLVLHLPLLAIWAYSLHVQTAADTIDPQQLNHGAPWYITKNCNVASTHTLKGYCEQAKSAFAVSVCMLAVMFLFTLLTLYSLWPTKDARRAHESRVAEKKAEKEKFASSPYDNEMTAEEQWQHMWELQQLPRTPGTAGGMKSPITPRTRAFQELHGGAQGYYGQQGGYGQKGFQEHELLFAMHEGRSASLNWNENIHNTVRTSFGAADVHGPSSLERVVYFACPRCCFYARKLWHHRHSRPTATKSVENNGKANFEAGSAGYNLEHSANGEDLIAAALAMSRGLDVQPGSM